MERVQVVVRVRPFLPGEEASGCVHVQGNQILVGESRCFGFDTVLDMGCSREDVHRSVGASYAQSFYDGLNVSLIAYGQTGSGKTFTMTHLSSDILNDIFRLLADHGESLGCGGVSMRLSAVEVYNEVLGDLLAPENLVFPSAGPLQQREAPKGGVHIPGLQEVEVFSQEELQRCIDAATANRKTASTLLNAASSRSHCLVTVTLTRRGVSSRCSLVDLAGSERLKKSLGFNVAGDPDGASPFVRHGESEESVVMERAREGIHINGGLLALGNAESVILQLRKEIEELQQQLQQQQQPAPTRPMPLPMPPGRPPLVPRSSSAVELSRQFAETQALLAFEKNQTKRLEEELFHAEYTAMVETEKRKALEARVEELENAVLLEQQQRSALEAAKNRLEEESRGLELGEGGGDLTGVASSALQPPSAAKDARTPTTDASSPTDNTSPTPTPAQLVSIVTPVRREQPQEAIEAELRILEGLEREIKEVEMYKISLNATHFTDERRWSQAIKGFRKRLAAVTRELEQGGDGRLSGERRAALNAERQSLASRLRKVETYQIVVDQARLQLDEVNRRLESLNDTLKYHLRLVLRLQNPGRAGEEALDTSRDSASYVLPSVREISTSRGRCQRSFTGAALFAISSIGSGTSVDFSNGDTPTPAAASSAPGPPSIAQTQETIAKQAAQIAALQSQVKYPSNRATDNRSVSPL
eukprot:gene641-358_t